MTQRRGVVPANHRAGGEGGRPLHSRPSRLLLLTEPLRSVAEMSSLPAAVVHLSQAPRGDGRPVLVIPGFFGPDASTAFLRHFLNGLGHDAVGWGLGVNVGPTDEVMRRLPARLEKLADAGGGPVSIIGWSLGGVFARALAVRAPHLVRQVITLGSPYATTTPGATYADAAYRMLSLRRYTSSRDASRTEGRRAARPLTVPATSIYSPLDGIVSWRVCREAAGDQRESIAVRSSHLGFGHHPAALWVITDRLAQPRDQWRPFVPPGRLRPFVRIDQPGAAGW